ncbi:MAG: LysR family transcriptional regulator [Firmicutes bacterium]|nr:LysR family transcriptional regulator [Bacillota bacterium]
MTLQQLKYAVEVADKGTITDAARELFISQPSLTNQIKALEKEMKINIFTRTNKGIVLSKEGEIFLGYARQVLEQANMLEEKYKGTNTGKQQFCVSTQHYSFAVNAFVELIEKCGGDKYDFSLRETTTYEIIEDTASLKSEIGILFINDFNEPAIKKLLDENYLEFTELFKAEPHIFVSKQNPLAKKACVTMEELEPYPYLCYEQGEHNSFYFAEEMFIEASHGKTIRLRDRATLFNLLIGLNGYTVCSGVIDKKLNGENIVSVPLDVSSFMRVGYIKHKRSVLSRLGEIYIESIKKYI